jgi:hypothetical protein
MRASAKHHQGLSRARCHALWQTYARKGGKIEMPRWDKIGTALLASGTALLAVALLLWWTAGQASTALASELAGAPGTPSTWQGDVSVAWSSTEPTSTFVTKKDGIVWHIPQYGITFTLDSTSITYDAVFTFTPRSGVPPRSPLVAYVFELEGVYVPFGTPVSPDEYEVTLHYDEAEIGEVQESQLRLYFESAISGWISQTCPIRDTLRNMLYCETSETGLFGVGAGPVFPNRTYLPLIRG